MILKLKEQTVPIVVAKTFQQRLRGLMGVYPVTYGMLFFHCNAIHTYFMEDNIDVIGLDQNNQVIYIYRNLPKNQIIKIKNNIKKTSILELPIHTSHSIQLGDFLFFEDEDVI